MKLSNKTYDVLKWIAMWLLPALATLWLTLGKIWNFPYNIEIGATISAIDVFLAAILGLSKKNYEGDGTLTINKDDPEKDTFSLNLNTDIDELVDGKKSITFMIEK